MPNCKHTATQTDIILGILLFHSYDHILHNTGVNLDAMKNLSQKLIKIIYNTNTYHRNSFA
jgi:hypothetical protein